MAATPKESTGNSKDFDSNSDGDSKKTFGDVMREAALKMALDSAMFGLGGVHLAARLAQSDGAPAAESETKPSTRPEPSSEEAASRPKSDNKAPETVGGEQTSTPDVASTQPGPISRPAETQAESAVDSQGTTIEEHPSRKTEQPATRPDAPIDTGATDGNMEPRPASSQPNDSQGAAIDAGLFDYGKVLSFSRTNSSASESTGSTFAFLRSQADSRSYLSRKS